VKVQEQTFLLLTVYLNVDLILVTLIPLFK
jgi:hypothetical protein